MLIFKTGAQISVPFKFKLTFYMLNIFNAL